MYCMKSRHCAVWTFMSMNPDSEPALESVYLILCCYVKVIPSLNVAI